MSTLGSRIKMARGKESQEKFAARLEISKGALGFYERDENLPNTDVVLKICALTGVSLNWLLTGGESPPQARQDDNGSALFPAAAADQRRYVGPQYEQENLCAHCADLKNHLTALEDERRELCAENRSLWKKLCSLLEEASNLRERLARMDMDDPPSGRLR